ncbi:MAG: D-alanine-D-alanine ligase [Parcubacteria group bacterium GW2011_GWA2_44_15]|nr:MAG: D-alanine-D-alanine ligase [Parcubacteria group bacterium GW2011_GWA2_44_15]
MAKKINLAIIFGGESREHEISLKSASAVMQALDLNKYNVLPIAITKRGQWLIGKRGEAYLKTNLAFANKENGVTISQSQKLLVKKYQEKTITNFMEGEGSGQPIDLVIPLGHGTFMEDGRLQGILDSLHLPYIFSGCLASALAMNKNLTKIIAKNMGLTVAADLMVKRGDKINAAKIIKILSLPIVIKPNQAGSSVGVSIAKNIQELKNGIATALNLDKEALLEQFISGRELTCAIFGNSSPRALPVAEIVPKVSGWFDYKAKYADQGSDEICPAKIPKTISQEIQKDSLTIFKALGCKDLARADFIWNQEDNKPYFLEINTIPGLTAQSLAPKIAKAAGLNFKSFIEKLIEQGME